MEKQPKLDYSDIKFKDNGKLKLIIVVGTRPEIIRLAAVITKCRQYFDVILAHTGQNYDYNLNGIFFKDLKLAKPEVYMDAVGDDLGATCGNIINCSYKLFAQTKPDGVLVLGDTNSCLSIIGAKRLHIPIFHMEAGNRCKDECLPEETNRRIVDIISDVNMAYSEHARRYLADCGLPKERTYVTGSPMAEVLRENLAEIEKTINDFLYAYDGKNYYQVYSFKDNVNASLSEALSVNALNDISDYVASAENNNTFHKVITDVPGIVTYYTDGFENVTVDNFTAAMFDESNYSKNDLKTNPAIRAGSPEYKLIDSEYWNIIVPVPDATAESLKDDDTIKIRFLKDAKEIGRAHV